jgi:hypoxanthine phosphoribosyltransferase
MKKYDLEPLIEQEIISKKIVEIGKILDEYYDGEELTIIMVMKGAICLVADLIRSIHVPCSIDFVQAISYKGMERGSLTVEGLDKIEIKNKNILLIDDIYDSGTTLTVILNAIKQKHPKTLKSLVLLCKNVPRKTTYTPDYVLFSIEDRFVVGYGLDYKEHYRGLSGVYVLVPKTEKS